MLELIKKRRSIRVFTEQLITPGEEKALLTAALLGPTSKNKKPVEFLVVREKALLSALAQCKASGTQPLNTAPVAMVVMGNSSLSDVWVEDASIAALLLQLQAEAMNLGSTWIQMRQRTSIVGEDSEEAVRRLLGIPAHYGVLCIVALGHKGEQKAPYVDSDADFSKVYENTFGQSLM